MLSSPCSKCLELDLLCIRVVSSGAPLTAVEIYGNVPSTVAGQERVCVSAVMCGCGRSR